MLLHALKVERPHLKILLQLVLLAILKKQVISAVIFGSVARREEKPQSDLDICCVVNSIKEKNTVRALLNAKMRFMNVKYGIKLAPVFFTIAEFKKKINRRLINEIFEEGILITGKNPRELING